MKDIPSAVPIDPNNFVVGREYERYVDPRVISTRLINHQYNEVMLLAGDDGYEYYVESSYKVSGINLVHRYISVILQEATWRKGLKIQNQ